MQRRIIVTDDNSKTLLIPELKETYHSTKGAIREAEHVFIKNGLDLFRDQQKLNIFEMGFGTGLNALATLNYADDIISEINYHSIEKYPLELDIIKDLGYCSAIDASDELQNAYYKMHEIPWQEETRISDKFNFQKLLGDIAEIKINSKAYHIIYYDAFGPKVQPKLWETGILEKMHQALLPDGILVTYCAQGQFKRNLKAVGFEVESLPGPPGKREMVRAIKK